MMTAVLLRLFSLTSLIALLIGGAQEAGTRWPTQGEIAVSNWDRAYVYDLWLIDVGRRQFVNLTHSPGIGERYVIWSPDGQSLLFSYAYLGAEIQRLRALSAARRVDDRILYQDPDSDTYRIADWLGTGELVVTDGPALRLSPWPPSRETSRTLPLAVGTIISPDQRWGAGIQQLVGGSRVYLSAIDRSQWRGLTANDGRRYSRLTWDAASERLAALYTHPDRPAAHVHILDITCAPDCPALDWPLPTQCARVDTVHWSPLGRWLVYTCGAANRLASDLYLLDSANGESMLLTPNRGDRNYIAPVWRPLR